jgi:hypothetical protein
MTFVVLACRPCRSDIVAMSDWLRGPLLGALVGLPILGGGGRLAMHAVALSSDAQHSVSVQGTISVLLAGLAAGIAGGAIYALLARVLPARRPLRDMLFAGALVLLTLRGLHPVESLTFVLFMPVVLLYGVALERAWHTRSRLLPMHHASP